MNFSPPVVTTFYEIEGTGLPIDGGQDGGIATHGPAWLKHESGVTNAREFLAGAKGDLLVGPVHGQQLVDLWAAHRALDYLIANGFRGGAEILGDGLDVIGFLRGENNLRLAVGDPMFARRLKAHVITKTAVLSQVEFSWVSHDLNVAANIRQAHVKDVCLRRGGKSTHDQAITR